MSAEEAKKKEEGAAEEEKKKEEAPAEKAKKKEEDAAEAKKKEEGAAETKKKEESVPVAAVQPPTDSKEPPKEPQKEKTAFQKKSTGNLRPTECASCGKAIRTALWYYRNGLFFCNRKCYKKKGTESKKKVEEEKAKK